MADKPHPSRQTVAASEQEAEAIKKAPDAKAVAVDVPPPEKAKRITTFAQAIARIERVMGEVKPGFHAAVRAWFTEAYPPQEAK